VSCILFPGQTGVMDRYYQCHKNLEFWQEEGKYFVCRIKARTKKTLIEAQEIASDGIVFYDAIVLLGTPSVSQTTKEVRLVGYRIGHAEILGSHQPYDLSAEQIALIYKLRWEIEKFFGWWKQHLKVYHLIARSEYGFMVQMIAGLITYLLLSIYCQKQYQEKVSVNRVKELRIKIQNEARGLDN
jgi:IS4 transposase